MGAFRMRPAEGASTAPSFICWSTTARSLCIASSVRSATSNAVLGRIDLDLRADAALMQFNRPLVVRLRLVALRLLQLDAGIDCLLLQDKLWISDDGDLGPRRDLLAFLDGEGGDRAADARAGGEFMNGLDGADHRLLVRDVSEMDHERLSG